MASSTVGISQAASAPAARPTFEPLPAPAVTARERAMPFLTESESPRKRRVPAWMLILAVMVSPLLGLFGWSCYRPVFLDVQGKGITVGYYRNERHSTGFHSFTWQPRGGETGLALRVGGGSGPGAYVVAYHW